MNLFEQIRRRWAEILYSERVSPVPDPISGPVSGTRYWPDLDYQDQTRSTWQAAVHHQRLLNLLRQNGEARLHTDAEYRNTVLEALEFWLQNRFANPNWWHNQIGVSQNIGNILLLLSPVLPQDMLERGIEVISAGSMARVPEISREWTGANLIWGVGNTVRHAVLAEDEAILAQAMTRAGGELELAPEGIQPDGSFFQHGPRLYSGGYGRSFAWEIAQLAYILQGTPWQFPQEKLDCFLTHILDGLRYMTRGSSLDYACVGRELTRPGDLKVGILEKALKLLVRIPEMPRQEELKAYLASIQGGAPLIGTRYFPNAALLCHHIDGLYVGGKFATDHTWDAEICNDEGELCYNMSYGTHLCIMADGEEYVDIPPLWDYSKIPGTTARPETDAEILAHRDWWCAPLPGSHYGGLQNGDCAAVYELAQHDGIEALVTHFAIPGGYVCLGAAIRGEALITTVDQCHCRSEVIREGASLLHGGVRYTALADTRLNREVKAVTGSWHRNNFAQPDTPVSGRVLTVYIPQKTDHYAFLLSPAGKDAPEVTVLRNDEAVQAIALADGRVLAVFHREDELSLPGRTIHGTPGAHLE